MPQHLITENAGPTMVSDTIAEQSDRDLILSKILDSLQRIEKVLLEDSNAQREEKNKNSRLATGR